MKLIDEFAEDDAVSTAIDRVLGVAKAYATRVGSGPFPTEQDNATGERLRAIGHEFGATTGRARRCGWLDLPLLRHAVMVNGLTSLALTKLDVLSGFPTIRVAVRYTGLDEVPASAAGLAKVVPEYVDLAGWDKDLSNCRRHADLPENCRRYIDFVASHAGIPIELVGVGPGRDAVIPL